MADAHIPQTVNVFVSYAKEDHEHADALVRVLNEAGVSAFSFLHSPGIAGSNFIARLRHAIEQAHFLVLLWSNSAGSSAWIANEIVFAQSQGKIIMPVLLDATAQLPPPIAHIEAIRAFSDRSGWILQVRNHIWLYIQQAVQKSAETQAKVSKESSTWSSIAEKASKLGKWGVLSALGLATIAAFTQDSSNSESDESSENETTSEDS